MTSFQIAKRLALFGGFAMAVQLASGASGKETIDGKWGGERLQLMVDANGGRIETDCASGRFNGPLALGADGSFSATGSFEVHRPGPQQADVAEVPSNARYSGDVRDGVMTLSVLTLGESKPQVFHLRKGVAVKLVRCL